MRIFLFLIPLLFVWGCSTIEVTKEVIKVTNTISNKAKDSVLQKETDEEKISKQINEEKEIKKEIENIQEKKDEEKKEEEKNIVESQQKLAEINFIGKKEDKILNLLGQPQLSRVDGSVYTLRYDSDNCRLFLFFNESLTNKRVEYFELRDGRAGLLNSKQSLEQCYREFNLIN